MEVTFGLMKFRTFFPIVLRLQVMIYVQMDGLMPNYLQCISQIRYIILYWRVSYWSATYLTRSCKTCDIHVTHSPDSAAVVVRLHTT